MRIVKFILLVIVIGVISSCDQVTQEAYKIGYVNLNQVYKNTYAVVKADSIHKQQMQQIISYTAAVESKISRLKLTGNELSNYTNACNDTILSYKQQIDDIYNSVLVVQNNRIQIAIDSLAAIRNYNYVISTINNNILYAQNNDDELTWSVIELLEGN